MTIEVKLAAVLASVENGERLYYTYDAHELDPSNACTFFRTKNAAADAFTHLVVKKQYRPLNNQEVARISDLCNDPHLGDIFAADMDEVVAFFISEKEWQLVLKMEEAADAG